MTTLTSACTTFLKRFSKIRRDHRRLDESGEGDRHLTVEMSGLETVVRIRREHADGKPIRAIARDLRLLCKVVRNAVRTPVACLA